MNELAVMSGMSGASMLRTRRKDVNVKPNRKLDRKSSRGMLYENEELRLRTININAEVERGQSDIKKLKRENDQLKREILALRYEYDKLDNLLRERRSSPEHSDDSGGCDECTECAGGSSGGGKGHVAFNELSVVPEEDVAENNKTPPEPCTCGTCANSRPTISPTDNRPSTSTQNDVQRQRIQIPSENQERPVDVIVHEAPPEPVFFQSMRSDPYHVTSDPYHMASPPPPGFVITPPRFRTGGNVEDLLGEVQTIPTVQTTFIQQNSVFMCNTRKVTHKNQPCCFKNHRPQTDEEQPKSYVTEKNIELNYDYPKQENPNTESSEVQTTTTEVASTVVFVEKRIPVKPKKFDFFFRSRSAPVGDTEEPIYATVKKLPKRLKRMDLANLEREVAYQTGEHESSTKTEVTVKTDSESQIPHPDDDTSRSEKEKSPPRQDTSKSKKRKRFSLTFKKRERKRKEPKNGKAKNGKAKNGVLTMEGEHERLIEASEIQDFGKQKGCKHRPRNTMSSSSSGPRYKRDSYQEMTTSHSEHERTSVSSSMNSMGSACTHRSKMSPPPQDSIPWCGCWGAGCV